jgi:deoxyribose-phosphate aldolase
MAVKLDRLNARALNNEELASHIQFTQVKPETTRDEIIKHLEVCARYKFNAAMIQMCWVPLAREILSGTGVKVATCIGLPMGGESLHAKIALIRECVALGADEIDYEPNMGFYLSGMYDEFREEAAAIVRAADGRPVKAMLEFGFLPTIEHKRRAATLIDEGGVQWIKQSSGWGAGGIAATADDVRLLRETVSERCKVKASGKVNSYERAIEMFEAGAEMIGTSTGPYIIDRQQGPSSHY